MERPTRQQSEYCIFIKSYLDMIRETHPDVDHRTRFKMAAESWKQPRSQEYIDFMNRRALAKADSAASA